eukprot:scaffold140310_cov29-Prasinocladus_malaysianus.AAC.1
MEHVWSLCLFWRGLDFGGGRGDVHLGTFTFMRRTTLFCDPASSHTSPDMSPPALSQQKRVTGAIFFLSNARGWIRQLMPSYV